LIDGNCELELLRECKVHKGTYDVIFFSSVASGGIWIVDVKMLKFMLCLP